MNSDMNHPVLPLVAGLLWAMVLPASGQLTAADDFEGYASNPINQIGGTGEWIGPWTTNTQAAGGTFRDASSKIDGVQSLGVFGNGSATGHSVSRPFPACASPLSLRFSMRAEYNVASLNTPGNRRMAFTIRHGNAPGHFTDQRLSFFFAAGSTDFQWYDGIGRTTNAVTFATNHVYDVHVELNPSDRSYTFTASNRNNGAWFSYAGNWIGGRDGDSIGSVAFMMRAQAGAGNDAFLDGVSVQSDTFTQIASRPHIVEGDLWRYFKGSSMPATQGTNEWYHPGYDDFFWSGPSRGGFGYGDCDDHTELADMQSNYSTVFTRKPFMIDDVGSIAHLSLAADYDDGFVAFINGVEVVRGNVSDGVITHTTLAAGNHEASRGAGNDNPHEKDFFAIDPAVLVNGTNVIAVSGHNVSQGSSDFSLIIELYTNSALVRGPFIQMPEDEYLTVAWRTAALVDSAVDYGLDVTYSGGTVTDTNLTRDHTIHIPGLIPGTQYYYRVRGGGETLSEGHYFHTKPATSQPYRIVVIGDHGQGTLGMSNIADRINDRTDFVAVMTVGDNVYGSGGCNFDAPPGWYDPLWFTLYRPTMRRVATFPAPGNHDVDTANGQWLVDYFRLPTNGPPGQIGKNYSFQFGNAHVAVIDTEPFEDNQAAVMDEIKTWLSNDLAAATMPWRIAFLHRPPFTSQGNHNDQETVKAHIVPILKAAGVHVVFQGHNHFYERINAIDGIHYITSGACGAGLYGISNRKAFSARLYNDRHSYTILDIDGGRMALQQINDLGDVIDEYQYDIDHPFMIDGLLDDGSWLRAQNGLRLYAAIRENYLYVATQDAGEGSDHFIYVAEMISTQRTANWAKSGTIMQWGAFLADENDGAFHRWYGADEDQLTDLNAYRSMTSGINNNAPNTNGVLEGSMDLVTHFGSFPQQLYLAAAPYGTDAGGALVHTAQVPAGNGDGDIQSNEFLTLNARDIALDLPVAHAGTNYQVEAGLWAVLDGSDSASPIDFPLTYDWEQVGGPAVSTTNLDMQTAAFVITSNVAVNTDVTFRLRVNDGRFDSDDALITVTLHPMTDSDGDGLSDQEELTGVNNTLTTPNPNGHITDPNNPDSDGDGMNDGNEALAGTDPNDANSTFKIVTGEWLTEEGIQWDWTTVTGRTYRVEYADEWLTNTWTDLQLFIATSTVTRIVDTNALNVLRRYYRVGVEY